MKIYFSFKIHSRTLLYMTLPGAMLLGNVFVFGQGRKLEPLHFSQPAFGQAQPGYLKPPALFKVTPGHAQEVPVLHVGADSVRALSPDRMPCLVTDLSRVERMPVRRQGNPDPMPNGGRRKPGGGE